MVDTYSPNLAVRLPATGAYNNTWGATLNTDTFTLLDQAIAGASVINVGAGTSYDFPAMTPGGASVSRSMALIFTGTPSSTVTARLDGSIGSKFYVVENVVGMPLRLTYGGAGRSALLFPGEIALVYADGANVDIFSTLTAGAGAVQQVDRGGTGVTTYAALLGALGIPPNISGLPSWDTAATPATLVERDGFGGIVVQAMTCAGTVTTNAVNASGNIDTAARLVTGSAENENPATIGQVFVESGGDGVLRKAALAFFGEQLFNPSSITANGYCTFPNGLIVQWGIVQGANAGAGPVPVTFPIAFPNACFAMVASSKRAATGAVGSGAVQNLANTAGTTLDKTGAQIVCDRDVDGVQRAFWVALGN